MARRSDPTLVVVAVVAVVEVGCRWGVGRVVSVVVRRQTVHVEVQARVAVGTAETTGVLVLVVVSL